MADANPKLCECGCGQAPSIAKRTDRKRGHQRGLPVRFVLGHNKGVRPHGMKGTAEYSTWASMKNRCLNPSVKDYPNYGGRGIMVCERWLTFENFFADMGRRPSASHTIDRIDNDGNYEPGNCRWTDRIAQNNNRRNSRTFEHDGETLTLAEIAARAGISRNRALRRLDQLGWSIERVLSTPKRGIGRTRVCQHCRASYTATSARSFYCTKSCKILAMTERRRQRNLRLATS